MDRCPSSGDELARRRSEDRRTLSIVRQLLLSEGWRLDEPPENVDLSDDPLHGELAFREIASALLEMYASLLDAAQQLQTIRYVRGVVNHVGGAGWVMAGNTRIMNWEVPNGPELDRSTMNDLQAVVLLLEIADMYAAGATTGKPAGG